MAASISIIPSDKRESISSNPRCAPVAGIVTTNPGEGAFGRIAIRDANGLSHEILHTHTQYVKRGDLVGIGQPIGRMGNTGTKDQHVHYQLKDSAGHAINPMDFWDRLGPAKTDPGQPAYLDEYQQYLRGSGANAGNGSGNAPGAANMPAPGSFDASSDGSPPLYATQAAPRLGKRTAGKPESFFAAGTPAVPFVPPNNVLSPDRPDSLGSRFGNWASFPVALPNEAPSVNRQDSFADRFGNWTSSPAGITPRNPNLHVPPAEHDAPLGIFTGKPMQLWRTPVPLGGLLNNSNASGNDDRNWFTTLGGLSWHGSKSRAPVGDAGVPALPIDSTDHPNFSGGLPGRLVALAGIDPQNPNQPASPLDDGQEQADMRALDARLSSSGNIKDAVALYNARKSRRQKAAYDQA